MERRNFLSSLAVGLGLIAIPEAVEAKESEPLFTEKHLGVINGFICSLITINNPAVPAVLMHSNEECHACNLYKETMEETVKRFKSYKNFYSKGTHAYFIQYKNEPNYTGCMYSYQSESPLTLKTDYRIKD